MRALALVIGIEDYPGQKLKNPKNDAEDVAKVLKRLGFFVNLKSDLNVRDFDSEIDRFGSDLNDYDIGLFYFAGHALQVDGVNYLTTVDTNFESEVSAKWSSVTLNKVLDYMNKATNNTNLVILDACRDNPYEHVWSRGIETLGLAPMYAPKGTLIAYSTSPGEKAKDGIGRNGRYTAAFLKHIEEEISIEEFFKRVRNSLYAFTEGKQTSWEHTSLTGQFAFNSGQLVHSIETPYTEDVISDSKFTDSAEEVDKIINGLKTYDWYVQASWMSKIKDLNIAKISSSKLLLLGRNIFQTACGGEWSAMDFMSNLDSNLTPFFVDGENHVLNGILFEIYFDSNGQYRRNRHKNQFLDEIFALLDYKKYSKSFNFISKQLNQFSEELLFIPGGIVDSISIQLIVEPTAEENEYIVKEIKHEGKDILIPDEDSFYGPGGEQRYSTYIMQDYKAMLARELTVNLKRFSVSANYDLLLNSHIYHPLGYNIQ